MANSAIDFLASSILIPRHPTCYTPPVMGSLMSLLSAKSNAPPYTLISTHFGPKRSCITVMCNLSQIQISVNHDKLRGTSLEQEFSHLTSAIGNEDGFGDEEDAFCDWVLAPCLSTLHKLALSNPGRLTMEAFCNPSFYSLELEVVDGVLVSNPVESNDLKRDIWFMIPSAGIPSYKKIPHIRASDLLIVPSNNPDHEITCHIPELVQRNDGSIKFFKPAFDSNEFTREVDTQIEIAAAGLHDKAKVSRMCGIVVSNDQSSMIGLLMDLIPSMAWNSNLCSDICRLSEYWLKWERQVIAIVKMLHAHNIVWGDADPSNVVIDKNFDAWVVDFGGTSGAGSGIRKYRASKNGDWQGVRRIFRDLSTMRTMRTMR